MPLSLDSPALHHAPTVHAPGRTASHASLYLTAQSGKREHGLAIIDLVVALVANSHSSRATPTVDSIRGSLAYCGYFARVFIWTVIVLCSICILGVLKNVFRYSSARTTYTCSVHLLKRLFVRIYGDQPDDETRLQVDVQAVAVTVVDGEGELDRRRRLPARCVPSTPCWTIASGS